MTTKLTDAEKKAQVRAALYEAASKVGLDPDDLLAAALPLFPGASRSSSEGARDHRKTILDAAQTLANEYASGDYAKHEQIVKRKRALEAAVDAALAASPSSTREPDPHRCIGEGGDGYACPGCNTSAGGHAPWYLADGSTVMLPAEEVERRRKLAAKVIARAREWQTQMRGPFAVATRMEDDARVCHALDSAVTALGPDPSPASAPTTPGDAP